MSSPLTSTNHYNRQHQQLYATQAVSTVPHSNLSSTNTDISIDDTFFGHLYNKTATIGILCDIGFYSRQETGQPHCMGKRLMVIPSKEQYQVEWLKVVKAEGGKKIEKGIHLLQG